MCASVPQPALCRGPAARPPGPQGPAPSSRAHQLCPPAPVPLTGSPRAPEPVCFPMNGVATIRQLGHSAQQDVGYERWVPCLPPQGLPRPRSAQRAPQTPAVAKGWAEAPRSDTPAGAGVLLAERDSCGTPAREQCLAARPRGLWDPQPLGPESAPLPDTSRVPAARDVRNSAQEGSWRRASGSHCWAGFGFSRHDPEAKPVPVHVCRLLSLFLRVSKVPSLPPDP